MCITKVVLTHYIESLENFIIQFNGDNDILCDQKRRYFVYKNGLNFTATKEHMIKYFNAIEDGDFYFIDDLKREPYHFLAQKYLKTLEFTAKFLISKEDRSNLMKTMTEIHAQYGWKEFFEIDDFQLQERITTILNGHFRINNFRGNQLEAIKAVLCGNDVLAFMPTGMGKSLLYQLPGTYKTTLPFIFLLITSSLLHKKDFFIPTAVAEPGLYVIFSPLCSLIEDQIHHAKNFNLAAVWLSSEKDTAEEILHKMNCAELPFTIIFTTPEKYNACKSFQRNLGYLYTRGVLKLFVLDEVHCLRYIHFITCIFSND